MFSVQNANDTIIVQQFGQLSNIRFNHFKSPTVSILVSRFTLKKKPDPDLTLAALERANITPD